MKEAETTFRHVEFEMMMEDPCGNVQRAAENARIH